TPWSRASTAPTSSPRQRWAGPFRRRSWRRPCSPSRRRWPRRWGSRLKCSTRASGARSAKPRRDSCIRGRSGSGAWKCSTRWTRSTSSRSTAASPARC
ncbi:hypothetical protein, partial [Streptomyces milbemycinicus]|uniref:hypothetical protein n=1 Tax=Streptomyces milbemycinicus TaxID=476552 RepID=UPI003CCBBF25